MTDLHDLIARMAAELDHYRQLLTDDRREVHSLAAEARAALSASTTEHSLIGAYGWPLGTTDEQKRLGTVHILRVDRVIGGHRVSGSTSCGHTFCMSIGTWKRDVDSATAQDWIRVGGDAADGPASVTGEPIDEELLERQAASLAARPLIERVAALGDIIGEQTVGQVRTLADRDAAWLAANPPGQPTGACSCADLPAPVPVASDVYFEFVVCDADYCTQAGGIAPSYAQAVSEGQHYLAQYQQDGPHTLEVRRVENLNPGAFPVPDDAPLPLLPEGAQMIEPTERTILVPAPVPVPVSERLPEPGVKVLAHYFNDLGKGRTICAIWVPAKTRSDSYGDDDFTEYDEVSDTFYWPEGWYEAIENWDDLGYVRVYEGEVIYWQSLPKWPAHALPMPSGEVE